MCTLCLPLTKLFCFVVISAKSPLFYQTIRECTGCIERDTLCCLAFPLLYNNWTCTHEVQNTTCYPLCTTTWSTKRDPPCSPAFPLLYKKCQQIACSSIWSINNVMLSTFSMFYNTMKCRKGHAMLSTVSMLYHKMKYRNMHVMSPCLSYIVGYNNQTCVHEVQMEPLQFVRNVQWGHGAVLL